MNFFIFRLQTNMFRIVQIGVLGCCALLAALNDETADVPPELVEDTLAENLIADQPPTGFSVLPNHPDDNPVSPQKVALGRKLFFEPRLSKDATVACASCHRPDHGFANGDDVARGILGRRGKRNVPTIFNRGFGDSFSWDGKAKSLEEQVLTPIVNENELGNTVEAVIKTLIADEEYVRLFRTVFGSADTEVANIVTPENLGKAIAAFERTLVYGETRVDRFRAAEYTALSREARQGMWIFESRGGCWKCHNGENFADEDFHNTGVGFGLDGRDAGRFEITELEEDRFKFKTPTLRGVELTPPYMHDGSVGTLKEVVEFYNRGGAPDDPNLDADMEPLHLTDEEVGFLVEFLKALSK